MLAAILHMLAAVLHIALALSHEMFTVIAAPL